MTSFRMKALLLFFCAGLIALTSAKMYKATVKGTTICQSKRYTGVVVILMEKDRLDPDDELAKTTSDSRGEFFITGQEDEFTTISPYIIFEHTCNAKPNCKRQTTYEIPKEKVDQEYDMSYVALDIVTAVDKEICP
ncbi:hypothetical protein WR25_19677 [Diploscapter pachys]|uniref:Transthyretin-like family protein n=1 Tax=Diploscapter pachys TaxID=2018661 RepID=A0A2A2JVP7_9BILA|nr:hypothetical protein WR25_19677 [Diploscapter pachys]